MDECQIMEIEFDCIELVGEASRMPYFHNIINEVPCLNSFNPQRTMNTIEALANGCSIHAHQLECDKDATFLYDIFDYNPLCIKYAVVIIGQEEDDLSIELLNDEDKDKLTVLFEKGC